MAQVGEADQVHVEVVDGFDELQIPLEEVREIRSVNLACEDETPVVAKLTGPFGLELDGVAVDRRDPPAVPPVVDDHLVPGPDPLAQVRVVELEAVDDEGVTRAEHDGFADVHHADLVCGEVHHDSGTVAGGAPHLLHDAPHHVRIRVRAIHPEDGDSLIDEGVDPGRREHGRPQRRDDVHGHSSKA
jgi:hypothetical protein